MGLKSYLKRIWDGLAPRGANAVELPRFAPAPAVRKRLVFSGVVQGVGFRYEAMQLAERLGLTGWIQNRTDGSVEAEMQGEAERIAFLIGHMRSLRRAAIHSVTEELLPLVPGETDFDVRWE